LDLSAVFFYVEYNDNDCATQADLFHSSMGVLSVETCSRSTMF